MKTYFALLRHPYTWIGIISLIACAFAWAFLARPSLSEERFIALLVPDDYEEKTVAIWRHAASEEGVKLEILTSGALLRSKKRNYAGILVPDTIHKSGSNSVTAALEEYVRTGGKMMLVFDALTLDSNGTYPLNKSRLSAVAGIDFAMYDKHRGDTIGRGAIVSDAETLSRIGITPGRYVTDKSLQYRDRTYDQWLTTYRYPELLYPFFLTDRASPAAKIMMLTSTGNVAAMEYEYGNGKTLFVNLPLGMLKNSSDSLPLHSFLRHFSDNIVGLPRLLTSPKGIGGLILNIHVDNDFAIKSLEGLTDLGLFDQGPYSIHFTAGPDVNERGDGMGMNASENVVTQGWIRKLASHGHAIGNHGGWIHNYFGTRITEHNGAEYTNYLDLNNNALRKLVEAPLTEYSSPVGNHPDWVTKWMAKHGMVGYYTTSNLGMGPTRMFRDDILMDKQTWSIPVTPFGRIASFEEAMFAGQTPEPITAWLNSLANYVADSRNIREIYCHPIGIPFYTGSIRELLQTTRALKDRQRFSWYTMTEAANFMSKRESASWRLKSGQRGSILEATHPSSLAQLTWQIPFTQCAAPTIMRGKGRIREDRKYWEVIADDVKELSVSCQPAEAH